jgi:hypothetical protein
VSEGRSIFVGKLCAPAMVATFPVLSEMDRMHEENVSLT